jgi:hypothetical protein
MIRRLPGEIRLPTPIIDEMPDELLQNSRMENPSATVGITKGISAKLSSKVVHRPRFLTISHARGIPASMSSEDTIRPIMNDQETASLIRDRTGALNAREGKVNN